jgi:hypothetical protein
MKRGDRYSVRQYLTTEYASPQASSLWHNGRLIFFARIQFNYNTIEFLEAMNTY